MMIKKFYSSSPENTKSIIDPEFNNTMFSNNPILSKIMELDNETMETFKDQFLIEEEDLRYPQFLLYHGLRYNDWLNNLEGIFEKGKILAGKHLENYIEYNDNCNDGEYVSLARYEYSHEFDTFIGHNVCLIINPFVEAYQTIYLSFEEWLFLKKENVSVKNRYSYMHNEYQVKDWISMDMVKAIGIPYSYFIRKDGVDCTNYIIQNIIDLMNKYNIILPIVDINSLNKVLYNPDDKKVKCL